MHTYPIHDNHDYRPTTTGLHKKQEIIFDFDARADVSGNGTTFFPEENDNRLRVLNRQQRLKVAYFLRKASTNFGQAVRPSQSPLLLCRFGPFLRSPPLPSPAIK